MSGWKARIAYLSPSLFETPSDWDLILPKGFTIVCSGLNVQSNTEAESNKAIQPLGAGLGIFTAEEMRCHFDARDHIRNAKGLRRLTRSRRRFIKANRFTGEHGDERYCAGDETFKNRSQ
jgi:hypothetical protein